MATTPDVSAAAAYGTKFAKGIILKIWSALKDQGITVYPSIKGPTKFGKLSAGKGLKPYTGNFDATGGIALTDRELVPTLAAYEFSLDPKKYFDTYAADMIGAAADDKQIPFANYMWQEIAAEVEDELVNSVVGFGDTASMDDAKKITNGLIKIINSIGLSPVITGPITDADVIEQMQAVYRSIPAKFRKYMMNMYVSQNTADLYNLKYRDLYHAMPTYNEFSQTDLPLGSGKCKITPVEWLGDSNAIIVTPQKNLVLGTDSLSDMNRIKLVEKVYGYDCAINFSVGFQVPDTEVVFINDELA